MATTKKRPKAGALVEDFLANGPLWQMKGWPFKAHVEKGRESVLLIAGPNASGKSILGELVTAWGAMQYGLSLLRVSMRERTGSGSSYEMSFMRRAMFGREDQHSTGSVSAQAVQRALRTVCAKAQDAAKPAYPILLLDEPEIGLADGYSRALGELIGSQARELPRRAAGVVVITHNKALAAGVKEGLGGAPTFVSMKKKLTMDEWLAGDERVTVEELLALEETDTKLNAEVEKLLKRFERQKKTA